MEKKRKLKIELAKSLFKLNEFKTQNDFIYSENEIISILSPIYIFDDDGVFKKAPDGKYQILESENITKIITITDGIVTKINNK